MANDQILQRLIIIVLAVGVQVGCVSLGTPAISDRSSGATLNSSGQYVVRKGDTLYSIAWRLGLDYKSLASINGIGKPFVIFPGQKLRLRGKPQTIKTPRAGTKPAVVKTTTKAPAKPAARSTPAKPQKPKVVAKPAPRKSPTVAAKKPSQPNAAKPKTSKPKPARTLSSKWAWPVKQQPIGKFGKGSNGLDYAISRRTNVMSAGLGEVVYAGNGIAGFERLVIVKHTGNLLSAYSFNGRVLVKEQQRIGAGMRLAEILPRPGVGQKLHFELRRNGNPINPGSVIR
ncbi:MAG: peptidoglycan DD-metalloendopeptidase family protein [Gammaproteobacteria bacterium]|jgi:lipoprotein NlpD|nr:peptidoglycan DD-metalloendopeptidase family protein [Gammaproteobacteria bacterium]MBT3696800.1 peptidoglycan DD-metalloendopeptidase family protein [Gammaproteobacteria bacterium]MBT5681997.1 peptidoglycan DD-metalloendopeptidase family protein [Gammaproteobacteria bacterium]MBT6024713.1 peptidoglycan DD-metalloendopeptidase family protein [Gammaproteobacteria bacterium]MBT6557478.1 peptidoglycan DD-metalloendopeptidase family protein [Gammaproteobacteria bacterium]